MKNTILLLSWFALCFAYPSYADISGRQDVQTFIEYMHNKHQFSKEQLIGLFQKINISKSILKAISKPAEKLPWYRYKERFITKQRIENGVQFWQQHAIPLKQAERQFGVPAEIIVAIIGIETAYGKNMGNYRVIDALSTLAFDYPKRSQFFRSELEQFFLLAYEHQFLLEKTYGSYAGAMGIAQFIASSYRNHAIDFNQNGKINLFFEPQDAIGSIANYLKNHNWQPGGGIVHLAKFTGNQYHEKINEKLKPDLPIHRLIEFGIEHHISGPQDALVKLFVLEANDGPQYWLGENNFYVITRYNHSLLYAMAVYQLAQRIKMAHELMS